MSIYFGRWMRWPSNLGAKGRGAQRGRGGAQEQKRQLNRMINLSYVALGQAQVVLTSWHRCPFLTHAQALTTSGAPHHTSALSGSVCSLSLIHI